MKQLPFLSSNVVESVIAVANFHAYVKILFLWGTLEKITLTIISLQLWCNAEKKLLNEISFAKYHP